MCNNINVCESNIIIFNNEILINEILMCLSINVYNVCLILIIMSNNSNNTIMYV